MEYLTYPEFRMKIDLIQARYKPVRGKWTAWGQPVSNVKFDFRRSVKMTWEFEDGSKFQVRLVTDSNKG